MEKLATKKRESGISRIVGVEESVELELLDYFKRQFEKDQRGRDTLEQEHTPKLEVLISQINEKMKEFLTGYGLQFLEIPSRNVHILDKSKLNPQQLEQLKKRYEGTNGIYLPDKQHIAVFENYTANKKLLFAQILIHEMIHVNAFASGQMIQKGGLQLTKGDKTINLGIRRIGFEIDSARTGKKFFYDVNEAITTELTIRFDQNYFSQFQDLKQEYDEREEAISGVVRRSKKNKEALEIANLEHREKDAAGGHEVILRPYSYHSERTKLNKLVSDLYEKNKSEFRSTEDVFILFVKAALSGRLLPIARLIEKTYGRGSFRYLGEKTAKSIGPKG